MINEETRRKLREINLGEAIKGLEVQQADPATIALPFDECRLSSQTATCAILSGQCESYYPAGH